eukprot:TRINITY_DN8810_c0_g1_i4.p1 TRINITY_DN8810_c0_g1~~TRINITY_DN8810_c0_g1_i4.p1  ORF type:complete len:397 (-),score=14.12 TRINITY_DN8810_c0_g1_i4:97-1251(-)
MSTYSVLQLFTELVNSLTILIIFSSVGYFIPKFFISRTKNSEYKNTKNENLEIIREESIVLQEQIRKLKEKVGELESTKFQFKDYNLPGDFWAELSVEQIIERVSADDQIYQQGLRRVTLESLKKIDDTNIEMNLLQISNANPNDLFENTDEEESQAEPEPPEFRFRVTEKGEAIIFGKKLTPIWTSKSLYIKNPDASDFKLMWRKIFSYIASNQAVKYNMIGFARDTAKMGSKVTRQWFVWHDADGCAVFYHSYMIPCLYDDGDAWHQAFLSLMHVKPEPMEQQERFMRDFMGIRYAPSMMTLVAGDGSVLSQNAASVGYHGVLAVDAYMHPCNTQIQVELQHFIKDLLGTVFIGISNQNTIYILYYNSVKEVGTGTPLCFLY